MLLLVTAVIVLAVVYAPKNTEVFSSSVTTVNSLTATSSNKPSTFSNSSLWPASVILAGNYTIQDEHVSQVNSSTICNKMIKALNNQGNYADGCTIEILFEALRSIGVNVRYNLKLRKRENETDEGAKGRGADAITRLLTDGPTFGHQVDPSSITFDDFPQHEVTGQTDEPTQFRESENFCSNVTWVKVPGGFGSNSYYQSYISSIIACQQECLAVSNCFGVSWFSGGVYGCYLNIYYYSFSFNYGTFYSYYARIDNQSNCDANGSCAYLWNGLARSQAVGAVHSPLLNSLTSCIVSCQRDRNCSAVDWDYDASICWLFINNNASSITRYHPYIYHFDKICKDPNATLQQPTTPTPSLPSACPSWSVGFCQQTQECLFYSQMCDKVQDCPNDIDETNCTCDSNHYQCLNGRCIYRAWLCDGVKDCPLGDDETTQQCPTCNNSVQFTCVKSFVCIPAREQCDGVANCIDSSDEVNCLTLTGNATSRNNFTQSVMVTYRGMPGYSICSDHWNVDFSDALCQHFGDRNAIRTYYGLAETRANFLALNSSVSSSNIMSHLQPSTCISNKTVHVACASLQCGVRTVPADSVGPYIINGQVAKPGAWPWQALLQIGIYSSFDNSFQQVSFCGAILLNERWLLTAGHCTQVTFSGLGYYGQVLPGNVRILLGSIDRTADNNTVYATVDAIFTHPDFISTTGNTDNDIGLLRLTEPVDFTDFIRPICLPTPTDEISHYKVCVDTGFGRNIYDDVSSHLQQVRMNVIPYVNCYYYFNYYLRSQTQICIGTLPTENDNNICFGDSGGPFACQDFNGIWKVFGVNSYVIGLGSSSATKCSRSIVARVTSFVNWIQQTMAANPV